MVIEQSIENTEVIPGGGATIVQPFRENLARHGLRLVRAVTSTLQINVGFLCNQVCRHCHLNAGPFRSENMGPETVDHVVSYARRSHFDIIDITGGAPEMNPHLAELIERLSALTPRIMLRSNLTVLNEPDRTHLIELLKAQGVVVVASFPSLNKAQADSQRGNGVFERSIEILRRLNALGYGKEGTGLELNLVSNPTGAFLPPSQLEAENRFHQILERKWGISFNRLFNFANVPLGRFRQWLEQSGNLERYVEKLASCFNPCAIDGLMCRTLVSVSWDGYLYDCDFNLARGLFMGRRRTHVSETPGPPEPGSSIAVAEHCYTCTAGAGFT